MTWRAKIFAFILFAAFLGSLFFDKQIIQFVEQRRIELLNDYMILVTNVGLFLVLSALATYLIVKRRYTELLMVAGATLLSLEAGYILKKVFQIPRPSDIGTQLTYATGYTFPSIHAAVVFSIIPFVQRIFRKKWVEFATVFILLSIAVSRIYLGVHFLSDIMFGGFIGYLFAWGVLILEQKYEITERFIYHLVSKREVRRQVLHMGTGLLIILLLKLNILNIFVLTGILVTGGIASLLSLHFRIPIIHQILETFERPEDMRRFPGKGSFYLVMGSVLALMLFEEHIALAAIAIMAVGDAITTLVGIYFGKIKSPFNRMKHLEGTMLAIMAGTIAAFNFVSFEKAFMAATVAMLFEAFTIHHIDRVLDDNLLIPLVAGVAMSVML